MFSSFLIAAVAALHIAWGAPGGPAPVASAPVRVAQAAPRAESAATDRAAARVAATERRRRALRADKDRLRGVYNRQLQEIDRLKAQRRSWRRDRQLAEQKAESQRTALALGKIDRELRALSARLGSERKALAAAIDREIGAGATGARLTRLVSLRAAVRRALRPPVRKILIPDAELDELADPEELIEQIAMLEHAETELAREEAALAQRAARYQRMADLRAKRQRADDLGELDDDGVRRTTTRVAAASSGDRGTSADSESQDGAGAPTGPGEPPGGGADDGDSGGFGGGEPSDPGPGGSLSDVSIVLSDVVDASTRDALRRADRSSDPAAKARAARRAKVQVEARLERLRKSRLRIETYLRRLRHQER